MSGSRSSTLTASIRKPGVQKPHCSAVMVHEGLLHRMQFVAVGEALDGADRLAVGLHGEHQTRAHRFAVDEHGARAADAVLAADMRAGLPTVLADGVDERAPRFDRDVVVAAVDA